MLAQTSLLAQTAAGFNPVDGGVLVLYDTQHWIAVACSDNKVLMANSLASQAVLPLVARQIMHLFAQHVDANGHMVVKRVLCSAADCVRLRGVHSSVRLRVGR